MSRKSEQTKALLARALTEVVTYKIKNPHVGMVSVSKVEITNDYQLAKVYVTFLGGNYPYQRLEELNRLKGVVRSELAKMVNVYKVPDIVFIYDERFDAADRIERALKKEEEDLEKMKKGEN